MNGRPSKPGASIAGLALVVGLASWIPGCGGGAEPPTDSAEPAAVEEQTAAPAAVEGDPAVEDPAADESAGADPEPLRQHLVQIYFPSASRNALVGESRQIFDTITPGDRAKQIIADLIAGPRTSSALRALPKGVRLRQVYVLANGVAYIDFSSGLTEGLRGGSMSELLTVYSVVDSVVLNVREVSRVALLVNGRPLETLNGHLDLRRPLPAERKLILKS